MSWTSYRIVNSNCLLPFEKSFKSRWRAIPFHKLLNSFFYHDLFNFFLEKNFDRKSKSKNMAEQFEKNMSHFNWEPEFQLKSSWLRLLGLLCVDHVYWLCIKVQLFRGQNIRQDTAVHCVLKWIVHGHFKPPLNKCNNRNSVWSHLYQV